MNPSPEEWATATGTHQDKRLLTQLKYLQYSRYESVRLGTWTTETRVLNLSSSDTTKFKRFPAWFRGRGWKKITLSLTILNSMQLETFMTYL